jgi:hypothetical protein
MLRVCSVALMLPKLESCNALVLHVELAEAAQWFSTQGHCPAGMVFADVAVHNTPSWCAACGLALSTGSFGGLGRACFLWAVTLSLTWA